MTRLVWDQPEDRIFQTGLDRGVLYPEVGPGVPWIGLVALDTVPQGGDARPYYLDGVKYSNRRAPERFAATLQAFTYPDEFLESDGVLELTRGLSATQQRRRGFSMCYRSLIGNAVEGVDYGYKIHILYQLSAAPAKMTHKTIESSASLTPLSWDLTSMPISFNGGVPATEFTIDSTKVDSRVLKVVEDYMYGTEDTPPTLLYPDRLAQLLGYEAFEINPPTAPGRYPVVEDGRSDLLKSPNSGLFEVPPDSSLVKTAPGRFTLEL